LKWTKAPEELKARIDSLMQGINCEKHPMFGYPAYFINKNMFAGLFQDKLFLRLSPEQVTTLRKSLPAIVNLEPMPGRPMKEYWVLPEELYNDAKKIQKALKEASEHCAKLPPKAKRPGKKQKKG
jgi:TfoX/Sxy family transcriptional regulator of competence genes